MPDNYNNSSHCEDEADVPSPCAEQPFDALKGQDVRFLFGGTLRPAKQKAEGEPFGDRVAWLRRPGDNAVVTMGLNSGVSTSEDVVQMAISAIPRFVSRPRDSQSGRR